MNEPRRAKVERRATKLIHKPKLTPDGVLAAVVAVVAFASLWVSSPLLGTLALGGFLAFRFARTQRRWRALVGHSIEITESGLVQRDATNREVGRVSFAKPITYEYLDRAPGTAIFELSQGSQVVRFTTKIPNAPEVAATLGLPWPVRDAAWRDAA